MNQNIKAAAKDYVEGWGGDPQADFLAGATYFQQSSGADEMAEALNLIIGACAGVEWNCMDATVTIGRIDSYAKAALAKYNSFIKTEEDGKEE